MDRPVADGYSRLRNHFAPEVWGQLHETVELYPEFTLLDRLIHYLARTVDVPPDVQQLYDKVYRLGLIDAQVAAEGRSVTTMPPWLRRLGCIPATCRRL